MPDNTNIEAPVQVNETNAAGSGNVITKDGYTLEKISFSGKKKGFEYYVPQYLSWDVLYAKFGKGDIEEGKRIALGLLNGAVKQSFGGRATQRMPAADKEEDTKKLIDAALTPGAVDSTGKPLNLLITDKEADEWVPGTRDRVSLITLNKEFNEAIKAGNAELAAELLEEIQAEQNRKMEEMLRMATAEAAASQAV